MSHSLGEALDQLLADIDAKAKSDPTTSYTATLLSQGASSCAKKLGEEGVELALALAAGTEAEIANEAADLLYHLGVALTSRGLDATIVADVLAARRGQSGLAEKASRPQK